ncbi:MAG TPA: caspase family protein [Burkholderiales bacterium]|nr:caspase family protein [Burkholderiales bacterium]
MKRWSFLGLVLLGLLSFDASALNNRALLIGISQYAELEGLKYADADVKTFSQILTEFGGYRRSDVAVVLNTEATKARIMEEINKVVRASKREPLDHFILMFAGHGMPGTIEGGRTGRVGAVDTNIFLAPSDASTSASSFFSTGKEIGNETFINRAWLAKQLSEIEAKSIVIILDSCYSGTEAFGELFFENLGYSIRSFEYSGPQRGVRDVAKMRNLEIREAAGPSGVKRIAYFASSREDQPSAEYDELRHGALSYCLFENIRRAREELYDGERRDLSVDSVYSNITALFRETKVKGRSLDEFHQPVLLPIPSYAGVKDMAFMSVSGNKRKEIQTGVLEVRTDPPGLQIYVDGLRRPELSNASLLLQEGKHLVELYMPTTGYRHSFTVDISPQRTVTETIVVRGVLQVASFWLQNGAKSTGPALDVYLDGTALGRSGSRVDNIVAGSHTLEVRFEKVRKSRRIEIRPDSPLTVNYSVIRQPAPAQRPKDRGAGNVTF